MTTLKLFDNISRKTDVLPKLGYGLFWLALFVATLGAGQNAYAAVSCTDEIKANVVVLDNPTVFNRLGAQNPNWITYALKRDVVHKSGARKGEVCQLPNGADNGCQAGNVELRPDKRPRPLVIRSIEGSCLTVTFWNYLDPTANPNNPVPAQNAGVNCALPENAGNPVCALANNDQVGGRCAGFHASGTELVNGMEDDGSMVGANDGGNAESTVDGQASEAACGPGLAPPGGMRTYELYTPHEGAFIINSYGATLGSEASSGNLGIGMFGALDVQPKGARLYRSQVTEEEMRLAATDPVTKVVRTVPSDCMPGQTVGIDCNPGGQPMIDYEATYPIDEPWISEGKAGLPIINMLTADRELVHSDINAIIAGPLDNGTFPPSTYPLENAGFVNPQLPNRLEAFREFTSQFHDEQTNSQVFPRWYNNPVMRHVVHGVKDQFMINYGSGGIGSEIIANRLRTGPMHDCTNCAYEEFFLASQTVGDPAMLVQFPANTGIELCDPANIINLEKDGNGNVVLDDDGNPTLSPVQPCWRDPVNLANGPVRIQGPNGVIENFALYQEDPTNVHHAYTGDFVKYRNTHAGAFEQHIFHFHNHQWLFNPNDDNANYLDAQEIMPGSGHTYELVNGGAGNRNHTVGDAIFHCHFYPHFAQGMWYHQRNHDVFEAGTLLAVSTAAGDNLGFGDVNGDGYHDQAFALRSGQPAPDSRAYPDGELPDGSPIPAVIPLPGKPMAQMPAKVSIMGVDRGSYSVLGGRGRPDGQIDSAQAVVDRASVAGADGNFGTADDKSPGYPFWLAGNECGSVIDPVTEQPVADPACGSGIVGQRMPTPPLDMLTEDAARFVDPSKSDASATSWANLGGGHDGGLPRHALLGYVSAGLSADTNSRLDFRKIVEMAKPVYFPETGTDLEKVSMAYQAVRLRPGATLDTDGNLIDVGDGIRKNRFVLNGAPPVPGGPYNDPCVDDRGVSLRDGHVGEWYDSDLPEGPADRWTSLATSGRSPFDAENPRTYKIANLQIDAVFNKVGYHYSQERIIILWEDVFPTILKDRPPEPLVMRFNTFDCGKLLHANLVPHEFELDDFQVRTPTDIIGQHIHLPKWDLTTNDGAANGWNYEDGTLAPGIVEERIHAINRFNGIVRVGQACAADSQSNQTFTDPVDGHVFRCADFDQAQLAAGNAVLLPVLKGQLGPIDLTDQVMIATLPNPCGDVEGEDCGTKGGLTDNLTAAAHPFFGEGFQGQHYTGARTTIQRILVDPVVNVAGVDRGLGLTFSHDHYGPSTFQQIGLYSTILAEPAGSVWVHNETGDPLGWVGSAEGVVDIDGFRDDGGPTSWQAAILTGSDDGYTDSEGSTFVGGANVPDHREFYFEMSDFQHAYEAGVYVGADPNGAPVLTTIDYGSANPIVAAANALDDTAPALEDKWLQAVNPTLKLTAGAGIAANAFPDVVNAHPGCPGPLGQNDPNIPRPCAEAINIGHSSMWVVNYRNEPVGLRVFDPNAPGPDNDPLNPGQRRSGSQAAGQPGDLALAFQSRNDRAISALNKPLGCADGTCIDPTPAYPQAPHCQGTGDGINCDRNQGDPFTPIMRAYENDLVKVKIQVGATEEQHQTTIHGVKWLSNGSAFGRSPNSGWRNFQSHGISEQFSLHMPIIPDRQNRGNVTDYLYAQDATRDGIWSGTWGILRTYQNSRSDLVELPNNTITGSVNFTNNGNFGGVCPKYKMDKNGEVIGTGKGKNKTVEEVPLRQFNVFAVKANDVLPNNRGVIIPPNLNGDSDGLNGGDNVGGPLDPEGGTLVYNRRGTDISLCEAGFNEDGTCAGATRTVTGPLNDPTALMYVLEEDLEPRFLAGLDGLENTPDDVSPDDVGVVNYPVPAGEAPVFGPDGIDDRCQDVKTNGDMNLALHRAGCPVKLKDEAPVEPMILRAEAGDCIEATLYNKLVDQATTTVNGNPKLVYVGSNTGTPVFSEVLALKNVGNLVDEDNNPVDIGAVDYNIMPDLAGWQDTFWVVNRDLFKPVDQRNPAQMSFFGNNLIRPSAMAGLHAQLVEYDASQDDGVVVGQNPQSIIAGPGEQHTYRWYAGHIESKFTGMSGKGKNQKRDFVRLAFPIEFGGANLLSADRVKQPQKGLFGALIIEPTGAIVTEDTRVADGQGSGEATRPTRAQVTVDAGAAGVAGNNGTYRETVAVTHKIANLRWADGTTVKNVNQAELGVEGAEDSGHAGYNYGMEPSWFRFGIQPDAPFGNAGTANSYGSIPNPQAMYANVLVAGQPNAIPEIAGVAKAGDPQTPVFRTTADPANPVLDTRMHVLNGASADRDSTYILHGHVWQRDPFVCTGDEGSETDPIVLLEGRCAPGVLAPSNALGINRQAKYMGGEEGMGHVFGHWPILFDAGGTGGVTGDYLFRDYAPNGNRNGMFGILRVE